MRPASCPVIKKIEERFSNVRQMAPDMLNNDPRLIHQVGLKSLLITRRRFFEDCGNICLTRLSLFFKTRKFFPRSHAIRSKTSDSTERVYFWFVANPMWNFEDIMIPRTHPCTIGRILASIVFLVLAIAPGDRAVGAAVPAPLPTAADSSPNTFAGDIGPHHRAQDISDPSNGDQTVTGGRRLVEVATGMHFFDGTQWTPSDPTIEVRGQTFVAEKVQHPLRLNGNLNVRGAVSLTTPDGIGLSSTPVAIGLYDPIGGQSAIIGTLHDTTGGLISSNQVLFAQGHFQKPTYTVK
jgi:hypothetical protein